MASARDPASPGWQQILQCAAIALLCAGCASTEDPEPLEFEFPDTFSATGDTTVPERWWRSFDDAGLDQRIDRALDDNLTLVAAWERLQAARAVARREAASLYPELDALASAGRDEGSEIEGETEFRLGLAASYEIDLWGRIQAGVEAERLRADATLADYRAAAISLAAEVARTWYRLAEAGAQLELLREQVATNETVVELLKTRFAAGQISSADVLRQRQLVEATREQTIIARARIDLLEHQLAVLQGQPPGLEEGLSATPLPVLPPVPVTGVPGELVERRPDVQRSYLLLEAADRDLAEAVSAQFPRVTLAASLSTAAERPEDLFNEWLLSMAGQLVAPVVDGGRRRAEVRRTEAVKRQRLGEYGSTVLESFREVEDALVGELNQRERIRSLETQIELARSTLRQLRTQYLNGVTDYISVLEALTATQRLERDLLSARLGLVEFRIALYRALAGGFETPREERQSQNPNETDDNG